MDELRTMEKEEKTTLSNGQTNKRLTSYYYKTLSDCVGGQIKELAIYQLNVQIRVN